MYIMLIDNNKNNMDLSKKEIELALSKIGLAKNEIEIYLTLLELGRNNVSNITKNTSVNRTTGYVILNRLVKMGLVQVLGKKPKLEYIIESTEPLLNYIEEKILNDKEALESIQKILPQLNEMHYHADRPIVKYYEGIRGLKQVYEDTLTAKTDIVSMASYKEMHETLPDYFPSYYKRRAKRNIKIKGFVPNTAMARKRRKLNKDENRELALLPYKDEYLFTPEIDIYDNKVMIASWKEKLGIIIESQEIADALRVMFRLAWKEAERLDVNIEK